LSFGRSLLGSLQSGVARSSLTAVDKDRPVPSSACNIVRKSSLESRTVPAAAYGSRTRLQVFALEGLRAPGDSCIRPIVSYRYSLGNRVVPVLVTLCL
jgi:hypothetical protein